MGEATNLVSLETVVLEKSNPESNNKQIRFGNNPLYAQVQRKTLKEGASLPLPSHNPISMGGK